MSFANLKSKSMDINSLVSAAQGAAGANQTNTNKDQNDSKWAPTIDDNGKGYAGLRFLTAGDGKDLPCVRYWAHEVKAARAQ